MAVDIDKVSNSSQLSTIYSSFFNDLKKPLFEKSQSSELPLAGKSGKIDISCLVLLYCNLCFTKKNKTQTRNFQKSVKNEPVCGFPPQSV